MFGFLASSMLGDPRWYVRSGEMGSNQIVFATTEKGWNKFYQMEFE